MDTVNISEIQYGRGIVSAGNNFRLCRFIDKLRRAENITYGAIGGSITEGACASTPERRYVNAFSAWMTEHFPGSHVKILNTGIGASNSLFGTFRADKDLLAYKPDLVTIEYAVNDNTNPDTTNAYESLVRKCLTQSEDMAVILLFTMNYKGENVQRLHVPIGHHYRLPMLSYRDAIYPDVANGSIAWSDIAPDIVHPNDLGHSLIKDMLARLISDTERSQPSPAVPLPDYLDLSAQKYGHTRIVDANDMEVVSNRGWHTGPHKGGYTGWHTNRSDASLEVGFTGQYVAVGFKQFCGDFGRAAVSLDGEPPVICDGYFQKFPDIDWAGGHTVIEIINDKLVPGPHKLKISMCKDRHRDSSGHNFDIGYLLIGE